MNGLASSDGSITAALTQDEVTNADISARSEFSQIQIRLTGSFSTFVFREWGLRYLDNPLPAVIHDTGHVDLSGDAVKWIRRLRIKAKSTDTLIVQPYWDGEAATPRTIIPDDAGVVTDYTVPLGRQDYGKVGRVVITSSAPSHVFWVEFQFNGSGKQNQKRISLVPEAK